MLKQLLAKAAPFFTDVESAILGTLLTLRAAGPAPLQTHVDDVAEEYVRVAADSTRGIDALFPVLHEGLGGALAFDCLARFVAGAPLAGLERRWRALGGVAVKVCCHFSLFLLGGGRLTGE